MPPEWERKEDSQGRIYYVNHKLKITTWAHPITGEKDPRIKKKRALSDTPAPDNNNNVAKNNNRQPMSQPQSAVSPKPQVQSQPQSVVSPKQAIRNPIENMKKLQSDLASSTSTSTFTESTTSTITTSTIATSSTLTTSNTSSQQISKADGKKISKNEDTNENFKKPHQVKKKEADEILSDSEVDKQKKKKHFFAFFRFKSKDSDSSKTKKSENAKEKNRNRSSTFWEDDHKDPKHLSPPVRLDDSDFPKQPGKHTGEQIKFQRERSQTHF